MATKANKETDTLMEDPAEITKETAEAPKPGERKPDDRDRRIAELEEKLAAAEKLTRAYTKGNDYDVVQQMSREAAETGADPWKITVEIRVPVRRDTNDRYYWVCVNGRSAQIPANNEYQEMKLPFAEALVNMLRAEKHAQQFADEEITVHDPVTNPHENEDIRK